MAMAIMARATISAHAQVKRLALSLTALAVLGCATDPAINENGWTAEQQDAYDQCLQDNMAVATAWEMIERSCREHVSGADDPLGER